MTIPRAGDERTRAGDTFETLHSGLTVELISTHRRDLKTCSLDDSLADVVTRNTEHYDHLPVTEKGGRIVGLLRAADFADKPPPVGCVRDRYCRLSEEHFIGADASILGFIRRADCRPCRLVVSGTGIVGLVTLSDLQKLPVRAALFALVTGLEISMFEAIKKEFPGGEWRSCLSSGRLDKITEEIDKSKDLNNSVDDLLFTQFCDKRDILTRLSCFSSRKKEVRNRLNEIQKKLRDKLAHANNYAATPNAAREVCAVVRSLLELRKEIETRILSASPAPDSERPTPDSERMDRLRQAADDPLFLADLEDAMEPSAPADSEWWEPRR